jgi:hypothetical protein
MFHIALLLEADFDVRVEVVLVEDLIQAPVERVRGRWSRDRVS